MGYVYESRSYYVAVYRLLGCKQADAVKLLAGETFILVSFAGLVGFVVFEVTRSSYLAKYYVYMDELFSFKFYLIGFCCFVLALSLEIICMSSCFVCKTIKSELLEATQ